MENDYIIIDNNIKLKYIKNTIERIILLDYDTYWYNIVISYKDKKDIWNQFKMDIIRSNFYINYCPMENPIHIKEYLDRLFNPELVNRILMLSTQVIMGTPYELISTNIQEFEWYLGELGLNSNSNDKRMIINLVINEQEIKIIGQKTLRIFKINEEYMDENIYIVNIKLEIDLMAKEKIILKLNIEKNV